MKEERPIVAPLPKMASTGASPRDLLLGFPILFAVLGIRFAIGGAAPLPWAVDVVLLAVGFFLPYLGRWLYARHKRLLAAKLICAAGYVLMGVALLYAVKCLPATWLPRSYGGRATLPMSLPSLGLEAVGLAALLIGGRFLFTRPPDPAKVATFD